MLGWDDSMHYSYRMADSADVCLSLENWICNILRCEGWRFDSCYLFMSDNDHLITELITHISHERISLSAVIQEISSCDAHTVKWVHLVLKIMTRNDQHSLHRARYSLIKIGELISPEIGAHSLTFMLKIKSRKTVENIDTGHNNECDIILLTSALPSHYFWWADQLAEITKLSETEASCCCSRSHNALLGRRGCWNVRDTTRKGCHWWG